jgi:predicted Zn-dependent peptidase
MTPLRSSSILTRSRGLPSTPCTTTAIALLAAAACASPTHAQSPADAAAVLPNGITVLLHPVPGSGRVEMQAIYRVGFIHEPAGMTQAAHLLEHLVCNAGTRSYEPGESMRLLNRKGAANAETLPDWTHYDYGVPPTDLELALRIEAERLTSLEITRDVVLQEAPRCYQETDHVERIAAAGMGKHAFMALSQAWRHGREQALVRGGMEDYAPADLQQFHHASYRPENLTLVLIGDFERARALRLIERHLGGIANPRASRPAAIDWSKAPERSTVHWDSKTSAVCIAFPPPPDASDRIVLTLWGSSLHQALQADAEIAREVDALICPSQNWSVGELPFYVYAAARPGTDLDRLEKLLAGRLRAAARERKTPRDLAAIRTGARAIVEMSRPLGWEEVQRIAKQVERHAGRGSPVGMVMGQRAIHSGVARMFLGPDAAATVRRLDSLTADELQHSIEGTVEKGRQLVTFLVPGGEGHRK